MEHDYFNKTSATGLATTIAFLAVSLVPSNVHAIQSQNSIGYEQRIKQDMQEYSDLYVSEKEEESKRLISFAQMLIDNSKDDDSEIAKLTSDGFWEIHENF